MRRTALIFLVLLVTFSFAATAQEKQEEPSKFNPGTFAGLKLRNIGPALMSGRVADATEHVLGRTLDESDQDRFIEEALSQFSERSS